MEKNNIQIISYYKMNNPIDYFTEWKKKFRVLHIEFYRKFKHQYIPHPYNQHVLMVLHQDVPYCQRCGYYTLRLMAINDRDLYQQKRAIAVSMPYQICKFTDYVCANCDNNEIYHYPLPSKY